MAAESVRLDFFAFLILFGVVQGLFLAINFLVLKKHSTLVIKVFGILILAISLIILEMFLGYSGYLFQMLHLVDFSEPLNFTLGPLLYLLFRYSLKKDFQKVDLLHFIPFIFYCLYMSLFFIQEIDCKYNAYISAYFPEMPPRDCLEIIPEDPLHIRSYVNELTVIHIFMYIVAAVFLILSNKEASGKRVIHQWLKNFGVLFIITFLLLVFVKTYFYKDLGDFYIGGFLSAVIYYTSFTVVKDSTFFKAELESPDAQQKKYSKSSLTSDIEEEIMGKLEHMMKEEKYFLNSTASLPNLAKKLNASPHHVSQVLNDKLNSNFFDYIASLRVDEAKKMLRNPANAHLKIEEISEMTGYNSKSAFNTVFKKFTGMTPSQYKNAALAPEK